MFQLSGRMRRRWPVVHRWTGRVYLVFVATCMGAALTFLVKAPVVDHWGGPEFDLQLWALALGTLTTAALGFVAIRRRNIVAHQAWMGINIALMLTAPLLRVFWIGLKPIWPNADLLGNLGGGSISLAIVAPAGGAIAFMLTRPRRASGAPAPHAANTYRRLIAVAVIATTVLVVRYTRLPTQLPREMLSVYLVPWIAAAAVCAIGAHRSHRETRYSTEKHWRTLLTGFALVPVAVNIMWLAGTIAVNNMDAYLAATMVASSVPILIAFAIVVADATKRPAPKQAEQPPRAPARRSSTPADAHHRRERTLSPRRRLETDRRAPSAQTRPSN
jgi:hypothetical protein